jgi:hypothetical protein
MGVVRRATGFASTTIYGVVTALVISFPSFQSCVSGADSRCCFRSRPACSPGTTNDVDSSGTTRWPILMAGSARAVMFFRKLEKETNKAVGGFREFAGRRRLE